MLVEFGLCAISVSAKIISDVYHDRNIIIYRNLLQVIPLTKILDFLETEALPSDSLSEVWTIGDTSSCILNLALVANRVF